jgi:hypothetical protein
MNELSESKSKELAGGASACATSIVLSASIGGLFGGVGAVIGGIAAAVGPACLGIL